MRCFNAKLTQELVEVEAEVVVEELVKVTVLDLFRILFSFLSLLKICLKPEEEEAATRRTKCKKKVEETPWLVGERERTSGT